MKLEPVWVTLGEDRWLFDESTLTLKDYFVIKAETGLGRVAFINGIVEEDPASLQTLIWVLRRPTEPGLARGGIDFSPSDLEVEPVPAIEVPPTSAEGDAPNVTSATSATSTSTSSPAG